MVEGNSKTVYATLSMVQGDNLARHQMLGFTEGFSANYPCSTCNVHKDKLQSMFREDPTLMVRLILSL